METNIAEQFQQIQLNTSTIAAINTQPEDFKIVLLLHLMLLDAKEVYNRF